MEFVIKETHCSANTHSQKIPNTKDNMSFDQHDFECLDCVCIQVSISSFSKKEKKVSLGTIYSSANTLHLPLK